MKLLSAIQIPKTRVTMLNRLGKLDVVKFTTLQQEKWVLVGKLELDRKVKLKGSFVLGFVIITKSKDN